VKIAIIGCGAMGSVYAGLLASAGNEVLAIDRWTDHVAAINARGLRLAGCSGARTVQIAAHESPPEEPADMIVIAVKAAAAQAAAASAKRMLGPQTVVVTIQNGLGSSDVVAGELGPERLMVGIAGGFGASLKGPGQAHHNGMQTIRMGAYGSLDFASVERAVAVWREAGFTAEPARDIAVMQWEKLICNVAYSAPCTLTGLTIGAVMDDPEIGPVSRAAATEAWTVARARGIAVKIDDPVAYVRSFGSKIPRAKPSLLLDYEAGRRGEIDVINGAIPREGEKVGIEAPVNTTLVRLVRFQERDFPG
jgi:2-dehydropantoate 2-reductase